MNNQGYPPNSRNGYGQQEEYAWYAPPPQAAPRRRASTSRRSGDEPAAGFVRGGAPGGAVGNKAPSQSSATGSRRSRSRTRVGSEADISFGSGQQTPKQPVMTAPVPPAANPYQGSQPGAYPYGSQNSYGGYQNSPSAGNQSYYAPSNQNVYQPPVSNPYPDNQPIPPMYNRATGVGYMPQPAPQEAAAGQGGVARKAQKAKQNARKNAAESSGGGPKKPRKTFNLKLALIKFVAVAVLAAAATGALYVWKVQSEVEPYGQIFLPNVYVDGINLSGMTYEQGSQAVWAQASAKQSGWYVRLKNESGSYKDITADMLGISFDPTAALQQAWAIGHTPDASGSVSIFALKEQVDVASQNRYEFSSAQQSANTAPIDTILDTLQRNAYRAPQDAAILSFNPDDFVNPFTFQQEVYGQWLDTTAVKEQILDMVNTLQSGEILLQTTPIVPQVTVADLQKTVTLRCRAVTPIASNSTEDRTNNIRVAFSKINGKSYADGEKFSFNKVVGRRTLENGFFEAIEYAYGEEVLGVGGGVCQASTTVYLAAIQGGLTITDRDAHSNPVSYTSLGMDATVSDTRGREVDFVFRNKTGGRIFIAAHVVQSGANKRSLLCEVRIYGPSLENVHYKLESETIEVLPKPEEPKLTEDKNGEHVIYNDETKMISKGREGYVVETYLCTYENDQQVSRERVSKDTYPARPDTMWVGITPRVP